MKKKVKKLLCMVLAFAMLCGQNVFAADTESETPILNDGLEQEKEQSDQPDISVEKSQEDQITEPEESQDLNTADSAQNEQSSDVVTIPDTELLKAIKEKGIDTNGDGLIQKSELAAYEDGLEVGNVQDFSGLEYATNLSSLFVYNNSDTIKNIEAIKNLGRLRYLSLNVVSSSDMKVISSMTQIDSLSIGQCEGIDFTDMSTLVNLCYLDYSGEFTNEQEAAFITYVRNAQALTDIYCPNLSIEAKFEIVKREKISLPKGDIVSLFCKNIFSRSEQLEVTSSDESVVKVYDKNAITIQALKTGKTDITVQCENSSMTIAVEVTGIDENISTENRKENNNFSGDLSTDGKITVLRENQELWEIYPETKKMASGVEQYVAAYVYEIGAYNPYDTYSDEPIEEGFTTHLIYNNKKELWNESGIIAEDVVSFDSHYALNEKQQLLDIYNTKGTTEENVSDWGRVLDTSDNPYYSKTVILKTDGTLWSRIDVEKDAEINEWEQIASDVKEIVKGHNRFTQTDNTVVGYVTNTGEFIKNDGTSISGYIEQTDAGVWTDHGFYLQNYDTFTNICNFKIKQYFYKWTANPDHSTSDYYGLIDEDNKIYRVAITYDSSSNSTTYGEPILVGTNYLKPLDYNWSGSLAFYYDKDNKLYDLFGNQVTETMNFEKMSHYIDNDNMLWRYGVAILSKVVQIQYTKYHNYAIRTDGTVWDVTGVPTMVTNYAELTTEQIENAVDTINNAGEGGTVAIDMDSATVIAKDILEAAKGKDVDIQLNLNGYSWTVKGKDINAETLHDVNMEVTLDTSNIPQDKIDDLANPNDVQQLSLAYEGTFGFSGKLTIHVGKEKAGQTANLYYFENGEKFTKTSTGIVDAEGDLTLEFEHASDYAIVYTGSGMKADVNQDEKVNLKDLMIILKHVSGKELMNESQQAIADVNEDGNVNLKDLMLVLKYVNGKITSL